MDLGAKIHGAEMCYLGAKIHGAEMCYLGAMIHGAEVSVFVRFFRKKVKKKKVGPRAGAGVLLLVLVEAGSHAVSYHWLDLYPSSS
jgi:hypothetical protein